jgi:hypothetical protein
MQRIGEIGAPPWMHDLRLKDFLPQVHAEPQEILS